MADVKNDPYLQGILDRIATTNTGWGGITPPPHHTYSDPKDQAEYNRGDRDAMPDSFLRPNVPIKLK